MMSCILPTHFQPSGAITLYVVVWHSSSELASLCFRLFLHPRIIAFESHFSQAALTERARHAQERDDPQGSLFPRRMWWQVVATKARNKRLHLQGRKHSCTTLDLLAALSAGERSLLGCTAGSVTLQPFGTPDLDEEERRRRGGKAVPNRTTNQCQGIRHQ